MLESRYSYACMCGWMCKLSCECVQKELNIMRVCQMGWVVMVLVWLNTK